MGNFSGKKRVVLSAPVPYVACGYQASGSCVSSASRKYARLSRSVPNQPCARSARTASSSINRSTNRPREAVLPVPNIRLANGLVERPELHVVQTSAVHCAGRNDGRVPLCDELRQEAVRSLEVRTNVGFNVSN